MSLQRKLKIALDETRLLILGAQVLFGFQFNGMFQEAFGDLHLPMRLIACAGLVLIMIAIGLLIAPSMQHRIAERGEDADHSHFAVIEMSRQSIQHGGTGVHPKR
jgi:Family of unknown function (DUF6328)